MDDIDPIFAQSSSMTQKIEACAYCNILYTRAGLRSTASVSAQEGHIFTWRTEDASENSIMGESVSVCRSTEKAKLRPNSALSKVSLHQSGRPDANIALVICYALAVRGHASSILPMKVQLCQATAGVRDQQSTNANTLPTSAERVVAHLC